MGANVESIEWDIGDNHFTGAGMQMLVRYLSSRDDAALMATVFEQAGETRSVDELLSGTVWSSYRQMRSLLEAMRLVLPAGALGDVAVTAIYGDIPASATPIQDSGSIAALFAQIDVGASSIATVLTVDSEEVGGNEWLIKQQFKPGWAPFREYCEFSGGLLAAAPVLFGHQPARVVHESCEVDGATECVFRVSWDAIDEDVRRADFFERRAQLLSGQIDTLQSTVAELVMIEDIEELLTRVLDATAAAVYAPSFVLVLTGECSVERRVFARGVSAGVADRIARELRHGGSAGLRDRAVVEIASARRLYGALAALRPEGRGFLAGEVALLEAYARLAAVALDSATAVEDARRQASTARSLLGLSQALTVVTSISDVAATIVRAAPDIAGCEQAAVVLRQPATGGCRLEAIAGFEAGAAEVIGSTVAGWRGDDAELRRSVEALLGEHGAATVSAAAIVVEHEVIGWLALASANARALAGPDGHDRVNGLTAQATIAFSNVQRLNQIRHQALYDGLTGLPNRTLILDRADQMLARAHRRRSSAAALFLDIDSFKAVNDTLGHDVGDRLLKAVSSRLAATLRDADTIGRLGGDEFVILVEGNPLDGGPELVAQRLLDVLREPFVLDDRDGTRLSISASIGIAIGPRPSQVELLRDADVALYAAKAAGKACFVVFQPEMHTAIKDRVQLEADLRVALSRDEFFPMYQPIIDLRTMNITGVEALLRWRHVERGVISPNEFIPVLEETGLITEVGIWVLQRACQQTAEWHANGHPIDISVNVSARQLERDQFVDDVRTVLESSGLDPASLILEITESVIMRDPDAVVRRLETIKSLGVRIAIDDFGTGYSSLGHLQRFPVDCLKIDRSFIAAIAESPEAGALVHTLVQLGKTLGLQTLAEGIEETDQVDYLQGQDCDSGQGFLFAQPLHVGELHDLLEAQATVSSAA